MSIEAIAWASRQDLPPRDKFVLVALCDHYNRDQRAAWMKQATLAKWTGYNRETVVHALQALEHEHGLIESETRRYDDGRNASKVYRLPGLERQVGAADTAPRTRVGRADTGKVGPADTDRVGPADNKNREPRTVNIEPTPTTAPEPPAEPEPDEAPTVEEVAAEREINQASREAHTAVERRRARSFATGILAQQHWQAHAALQDLQGMYRWPPGQFVAIAERVLELARDHGTERTAKALDAVVTSGAPIKQPLAYALKILEATKTEALASDRRGPAPEPADLDEIFGLGAR